MTPAPTEAPWLKAMSRLISDVLALFGVERSNLLNRPELFQGIYVVSGIWQSAGWGSIIYLATLTRVDPALHEAAAQHAVHLAVAQVGAGILLPLDLAYRLRAVPFTGRGERGLRRLFLYRFFDKGIPFPARGALADPFGRLVPAVTAKKGLFDFSHGSRCVLRPR